MLKQPNVGDTVILKGIVKSIHLSSMHLSFVDCVTQGPYGHNIGFCRIAEIIQAPLKVGDSVARDGDSAVRTLLCIHKDTSDRDWGVVSYQGGIPTVHRLSDFRRIV